MIFSHVLYQLSYLGSLTSAILHYLVFFVKHGGSGRRKKEAGSSELPASRSTLAALDFDLDGLWLRLLGKRDGHSQDTVLESGLGFVALRFERQCQRA